MSISRAFSMYSRYCDVMVAMGMSLMSICCLRIRSNSRSSGPSYCARWKLSGDDTILHDSMRRTDATSQQASGCVTALGAILDLQQAENRGKMLRLLV